MALLTSSSHVMSGVNNILTSHIKWNPNGKPSTPGKLISSGTDGKYDMAGLNHIEKGSELAKLIQRGFELCSKEEELTTKKSTTVRRESTLHKQTYASLASKQLRHFGIFLNRHLIH